MLGAIALHPAPIEGDNLGYWIGRAYWGRGYATAAARAVIALAFTLLELDLVTASHLARNPASGRVLEKCAFRLLRTEVRLHRGADEPFCVRALTRAAWEQDVSG